MTSAVQQGAVGAGILRRAPALPNSAKGRRTRAQLLAAAREVFERDGFLEARVTDISAAAGASHGSFYTYFESKTDVFRTLCTEELDRLYAFTGSMPDDGDKDLDAVGRIERSNRRFVEMYRRNTALMALFEQVATYDEEVRRLRMAVRDRAVARVRKSIEQMQGDGLVDRDLDPFHSAGALVAMVNSTVHFWLVLGVEFDEETLVRTLTLLWARGLGLRPEPGSESTGPQA